MVYTGNYRLEIFFEKVRRDRISGNLAILQDLSIFVSFYQQVLLSINHLKWG